MPVARPAEAGREPHALPPRRRVSPVLLAGLPVVLAVDLLLIRYGWIYAAVLSGLYAAGLVLHSWYAARRPHLRSICENGLVVEKDGAVEWIDWRELASVVSFGGTQYDVNAKGVGYRLRRGDLGEARLEETIDTIIRRARFEWITDDMAARPEILERYRPTRVE